MMNLLPLVGQVYSLLIQEEKQRDIHSSLQFLTNSASMSIMNSHNPQRNAYQKGRADGRRNLFCDFCKKLGHVKDKCFKINGYPAVSKDSKKGGLLEILVRNFRK